MIFNYSNKMLKVENITKSFGELKLFQNLSLVLEEGIINKLSVRENVLLAIEKKMFHFPTSEEKLKTESILKQVSLLKQADNLGSDLSYGQQKLLTLGCCLANNPKLLLLDEPISGI